MTKQNFSHQRELILHCLHKHNTHLTVEEIFNEIKKKKSSISIATIYRNLDQLEKNNTVAKIKISGNTARYEINHGPHHHFVCSSCEKIEDLPNPAVNSCNGCISDKNSFTVEKIVSTIIGKCADCQKTKQPQ